MQASEFSPAAAWFETQGWNPFDFQREVWDAYLRGESGLIYASTGSGKTYAAWFGPLLHWLAEPADRRSRSPGLRILWLTPLKALAADTEQALRAPLAALDIPWRVERRTGDLSSHAKSKQLKDPPACLITTPESLSLLLSQPGAPAFFAGLEAVICDEWHELMGSKRGVQTELCLARLRSWRPALRTWGISATLGNLDQALAVLTGADAAGAPRPGRLVRGLAPKEIVVDSILPESMARFPWAGHLGLKLLDQVVDAIDEGRTTLVFTNTRSQTESWYSALLGRRPDWAGEIALHHGSLASETREWVEAGLKAGDLRCVVCTASLDLGVDFPTVERVLQIGSPKGVARLLQRAGRSGHQPGVTSRVTCVPTHALELVEVAAVRRALAAGQIEARTPPEKPLDLLVQHLVTLALGGGFTRAELAPELRSAWSYRTLSDAEIEWTLEFVVAGGSALGAYAEYRRVELVDGRYIVTDKQIATRHRMSIGTIVGDQQLAVRYLRGSALGFVTESFISRLTPGNKFLFAGKVLEFVRLREMTAWVKPAYSLVGAIPRWTGTSLPISQELGAAMRAQLADAAAGELIGPEMQAVAPILRLQAKWSRIPGEGEWLIEKVKSREGHHLFFYTFAGKLVNQGLAALWAWRLAQIRPITFTLTANDYGCELLAAEPAPLAEALGDARQLFTGDRLEEDIRASLNAAELARRQFREIARVAGLIFSGYPGRQVKGKQLQASSDLFYDVFRQYDRTNLLLQQADREVLVRQLEESRLAATLAQLRGGALLITDCARPTPFCFPLLVERMQAALSSESLEERIGRMTLQLERWAGE